jgi:hypothetical protein
MANTKNHKDKELTQEVLQFHLYYDAVKGNFEWQTGRFASTNVREDNPIDFTVHKLKNKGQSTNIKHKRATLYAQNIDTLPIMPRDYKPQHAGYTLINEKRYNKVMSGAEDINGKIQHKNNVTSHPRIRLRQVYKRYYKLRLAGSDHAYELRTYYLMDNLNPYPSITILGKKYMANRLAYHYMGYGLEHYNAVTGKRYKIPCRDGIYLNLSWDNIKPDVDLINIKPVKHVEPKRMVTATYTHELCIKPSFGGYWVLMGLRMETVNTMDDAIEMFNLWVSQLNGTVKWLRTDMVRVTKRENAHTFKRTKQS